MMRPSYADQTDIFNPRKFSWPVHIIGVGGIGSAVVLPLAKLGLSSALHLWDPDFVEAHNVPAQLVYSAADIGKSKVEAAADFLKPFLEPDCKLETHQEIVTAETSLDGVVIGAVDSMKSRHAIWEVVKFNTEVALYIDGRIGGEQLQCFTMNPSDIDAVEYYEETWMFDDVEGSELPCAARTVIHPPTILAGLIVAQFTRFARGLPNRAYIDIHSGTTDVMVI